MYLSQHSRCGIGVTSLSAGFYGSLMVASSKFLSRKHYDNITVKLKKSLQLNQRSFVVKNKVISIKILFFKVALTPLTKIALEQTQF